MISFAITGAPKECFVSSTGANRAPEGICSACEKAMAKTSSAHLAAKDSPEWQQ
jgi:hypothetical protein